MTRFDELARCRGWIEAALEYSGGTHSFDDVAAMIYQGRLLLWPKPNGCAVLELTTYPQCKKLRVFLAGGELAEVLGAIPEVEAYARELGCTHLEMEGRRGWRRALPGWTAKAIAMEKDLSNG